MPGPLLVTLGLDPANQARFETLRRAQFPPERNLVPAHITIFHNLPGVERDAVDTLLRLACNQVPRFPVEVTGLRSLGRGVAYTLQAPPLTALRSRLAAALHPMLSPQDRQKYTPHLTIQNKAAPSDARALLTLMQAGFTPFAAEARSLLLWRYLGGPWAHEAEYPFA